MRSEDECECGRDSPELARRIATLLGTRAATIVDDGKDGMEFGSRGRASESGSL